MQRRAVLGLDDAEHVGGDVAHHHRGVLHRQLVGGLRGQLDPADPVGPAVGDDLDVTVAGAAQQPAADDAQRRELGDVSECSRPSSSSSVEDPSLRRVGVYVASGTAR